MKMLVNLLLYPGGQRDAASLALLCKSLADVRLSDTVFLRGWACVCAPHSRHRCNVPMMSFASRSAEASDDRSR